MWPLFFLWVFFFFFLLVFIYLSAAGLSWGTQSLIFTVVCRIFSCSVWTLSCSIWDLVPRPRMKPGPPALGAWSLITRRPGKSYHCFYSMDIFLSMPKWESMEMSFFDTLSFSFVVFPRDSCPRSWSLYSRCSWWMCVVRTQQTECGDCMYKHV